MFKPLTCLFIYFFQNFGPIFIFLFLLSFTDLLIQKKYFHLNVKDHVSDPLANEKGGKTLYFLKTTWHLLVCELLRQTHSKKNEMWYETELGAPTKIRAGTNRSRRERYLPLLSFTLESMSIATHNIFTTHSSQSKS